MYRPRLAVKPRILILDKTDAAMDHDSFELFELLIGRLKGTCTILLVTNQKSLLKSCDRVFELYYGALVEKDPEHPENRLSGSSAIRLDNGEGVQ